MSKQIGYKLLLSIKDNFTLYICNSIAMAHYVCIAKKPLFFI